MEVELEDDNEQQISCHGRACGECMECDAELEKAIREYDIEVRGK